MCTGLFDIILIICRVSNMECCFLGVGHLIEVIRCGLLHCSHVETVSRRNLL